MLKAIYLDDKEHKYLIDFILSYKDSNNKNDINEAIKFLMIKGYQSLHEKKEQNIQKEIDKKNNIEKFLVEKSLTEKSLTEALEQLYTKINNDINNKFNMQLLENNSQLMSAIINMASKSNNVPQIIPQPYIMPATNIPISQQNNVANNLNNNSLNNNINNNSSSNNNLNDNFNNNIFNDTVLNNIPNKKIANKQKNSSQENIDIKDTIINTKPETKSLSTDSLLSNLLSNANR